MYIKKPLIIFILAGFLIIFSTALFANTVTLSTYYPAPFGAYDRLKLVPRETLPLDPHCDDPNDLGTMFYDNGKKKQAEGIYACQKVNKYDFNWVPVSKPLETKVEEKMRGNNKVVCVTEDHTFGVCMNNPSYDGTCGCQ